MKYLRSILFGLAIIAGILAAANGCSGCVSPQGEAGWFTLEDSP